MRDKPTKQPGKISNNIKKAFVAGSLFTTLIIADPLAAQTVQNNKAATTGQTTALNEKDPTVKDKITNVNTVPNAFTFALNNVDKYFPDMKEHLTTMMNSFRDQEHKDSTLALLNKMTANITDPEQKTGAVIYALEGIFNKSTFAEKYDSKITDGTFKQIETFDADYKVRFKRYYARLEAKIEKLQQEFEKNKQELEEILGKFAVEDIKNNSGLKDLMNKSETFYKRNGFEIPTNIQKLFDAAK